MNLVRSSATVSGLTMVSRVLGFVRDMLIATLLGTGPVADAFVVAFRLPNLFRRLFGEGAFNSAFVPLFAKEMESGTDGAARAFAGNVFSVLLVALLIVTAAAELAMPLLIWVIAPGFGAAGEKFDLAVLLTRIAFPYLLFMSLVALLSGVLNTTGRFAAAAAAPIVLNVVLISVLLAAEAMGWQNDPRTGEVLCWGVSFAGFAQFAMLWLACRGAGQSVVPKRPRIDDAVRRLVRLGIPGVIAGGITQVNIVIGTVIASLQAGAVSFLYYADRVYQLPLGVVGVAIGVVLLPDLSRRLRRGDLEGVDQSQNRALEFSMLLTVPAAIALMVIPAPVVQVLFERGAFTADDTQATAHALAAFAAGLPAFVLIKVFSPGFFAREDTRTPMLFAAAGVTVNIAASLALFFWIGHVGIAVATSLAGWVNAGLLVVTLARRGQFHPDARLTRRLPLIVAAALIMGVVLWLASGWMAPWFAGDTALMLRIAALAGLVLLGMAAYFAAAALTGAGRLGELIAHGRGGGTKPQ